MDCAKILEKVYESYGEEPHVLSLPAQAQIYLHLLFCPDCERKVASLETCREVLNNDFLPPSPDLENSVMAMISFGENADEEDVLKEIAENSPGGFSTRGWVIAGLVMLVSLATAFFGMEFNQIARAAGVSFLIPVGITIGIALSCYGAIFIGSHLKKLTERFGL